MVYCTKCGAKNEDDAKDCVECGAPLQITPERSYLSRERRMENECFGLPRPSTARIRERRPKGPDILGFVSAGVILIIIALTYIRYPIAPSTIIDYFQNMADQGTFIKPPLILFDPAIFFLYAVGVWGIVLSGLRIIFQRSVRKALGDLIGGFFSFFCAFLVTNYAADAFTGRTTLAYFVIAIGFLIVVNSIVYFVFPEK